MERKNKPESFAEAVIEGLEDITEQIKHGEKLTTRKVSLSIEPKQYTGRQIRQIREQLGVSQAVFAELIGTSTITVQSWEQDVRTPSRMANRFMQEIEADTRHWRGRLKVVGRKFR